MRTKLVLVLAIVMGTITTVLFYKYMSQFEQESAVNEAFVEVVAAIEPISNNERIQASMLSVTRIPQSGVHASAIKQVDEAVGKLADGNIAEGEVLLAHRLRDEEEEALLVSRKVREGYRAVSVGVNFVQTVSNLIEPEDYVDVIYTRVNETTKETITVLLFEKVRVLAVGRRMVESQSAEQYVEYSSATLELNRDQSVSLVNADEAGNIHLTLHTRVVSGGGEEGAAAGSQQ